MRRIRGLVLSIVVAVAAFAPLLVAPLTAAAEPHPLTALCGSLRDRADDSAADVGFVVLDLSDGTRCSSNAGQTFRTASLYKLVVLAEAYQQQLAGTFSLDETITIEVRHFVDDPEHLRPTEPVKMEAREALRRMIVFSSNSAALALYERLEPASIAAAPPRLGLIGTSLSAAVGPFVTTPSDVALLLSGLYEGRVVSEGASAEMLELLRQQELDDLIPYSLPAGTAIAHKTGLIDQYLHDAGIIFAPGGDYVMVLMTHWQGDIDESYLAIHELAGIAHGAFVTPFDATKTPLTELRAAAGEPAISDRPLARIPQTIPVPFVSQSDGLGTSTGAWWQQPQLQFTALAALALAFVMLAARRRVFATSAPLVEATAYARVDEQFSAEGHVMRFGSRSRRDDEAVAAEPQGGAESPELSSQRLQRLVQYFSAQTELLEEMRTQVELEVAPLIELLRNQDQTMQRLLANLDQQLRPLASYAESEEANLASLEQQLDGDQADFVLSQFQTYLAQQRQRIDETRERIGEQRNPFVEFGEDSSATVEVAVSRFDGDVDALEQNLAEQRKVMMRMLDAMRSESFSTVRDFLLDRESELAESVQAGSAHPGRIGERLYELGGALRETDDPNISAVVAASDLADERLRSAAPEGPRPIHAPEPELAEAADAVDAEERNSA